MRASLMTRAFVALGALVVTLGLTQAQPVQLVIWDFNNDSTTASGGVNASLSSLALVGGTTAAFASGSPLDTGIPNRGYNTTNYPTQGQNNLTAGIVFNTPTTGYMNITVQFDVRWSNTASKYLRFQYTTDGTTWINGPQLVAGGGDQWYSQGPGAGSRFLVDFTGNTAVDNNPYFAFRILAEFGPRREQLSRLLRLSEATRPAGTAALRPCRGARRGGSRACEHAGVGRGSGGSGRAAPPHQEVSPHPSLAPLPRGGEGRPHAKPFVGGNPVWLPPTQLLLAEPACASIKHTNPCGVVLGESLTEAFLVALEADPCRRSAGLSHATVHGAWSSM
jgi:hypothetical protein